MNATLTPNTLPAMPTIDENYVSLPFHVFSVETHECIHCGQAPIWDTFDAYVSHWYAHEYEGDRYHTHDERDSWEWHSSSCLATPEWFEANS